LEAIFSHPIQKHVILIDDARDFNGQSGYIALNDLQDWVYKEKPKWVFEIEDDIIRIYSPLEAKLINKNTSSI
jgi:hypothetical protein